MTTEKHIAETNLAAAIDQQEAYESLVKAMEAYYENAWDTAQEVGVSPAETVILFDDLAKEAGLADEVDAMWRI